jgi:SSS family solute:Na+ symporter
VFGHVTYIAISALVLNLAVTVVLTLFFRALKLPDGYDSTRPGHYTVDLAAKPADAARTRGAHRLHTSPGP